MVEEITQIKQLYGEGLSAAEIARRLGLPMWSIYKLMQKHGITRRRPHETNRLQFLATPLSFESLQELSSDQQLLKAAGLMLYWAEGSKRDRSTVDFANSDPQMIKLFIRFLRQIYRVTESRLRVFLYCYENQSVRELIDFWSQLTTIPANQFSRPYVRSDFRADKIGKMPYGLVHIRYSDQRLLKLMLEDIEHLTNNVLLG